MGFALKWEGEVQNPGLRRPTEPTPPRKVLDSRPAAPGQPPQGPFAWWWWFAVGAGVAIVAAIVWWLAR
jgi:hypothetical protein